MKFDELKEKNEAPEWMTLEGYLTLSEGYLLPNETPRTMYDRIATACASYTNNPIFWKNKFFDAMWKSWLCPASPVLSNMGSARGMPISCNSISPADSVDSIFKKNHELAILSKNGAGVGIYLGDVRGRGTDIKGNGKSEGIIPWAKIFDTTTHTINQGGVRKGASVIYLPVEHIDIEEFLHIRRPVGDMNRRCLNINHAVSITNDWMRQMIDGDENKRKLWQEILKSRIETGEPYILFIDNVNDNNPECYKQNNLKVKTSNLCSEITLYTDPDHSFVCCLSSLNLAKWDEWKDTDLVETAVRFLDCVLEEYIQKSKSIEGLEASRRSAIKGRAIGIGVLGWHSLLQEKMISFDSLNAMLLNAEIFKKINQKANQESSKMAEELGEPEWCRGFNKRHTHLIAIAPTVSNSTIAGGYSAGIEPISANIFTSKTAKGNFVIKNRIFEKILEQKNKNNPDIWKSIIQNDGSVQHLDFLSAEEKSVFLTAKEINQFAIVRQAGQRQKYIDQAQSVNLFFASNSDPKYIHKVHLSAWENGLKSLYYLRTSGVIKGDLGTKITECSACEG